MIIKTGALDWIEIFPHAICVFELLEKMTTIST